MSEDGTKPDDFNGVLPTNWKEFISEDIRASGVLENIESVDQIAKMAVDGRKLASNSIRIPSEDASEDSIKDFNKDLMEKLPNLMFKPDMENQDSINEVMRSMGMPETVEGYELKDIPEPLKENFDHLAKTAHGAGMTKKQLEAITSGIITDYQAGADEAKGQLEAQTGELKSEWGAAFDNKVKVISHFAEQTGFSEDLIGAIENGQLSPQNMKAFDMVVSGYQGEGVEIGKQPTNPEQIMTPTEADSRLNELMGNKDHAYWHPEDPEHDAAKKKVLELGKLAEDGKLSETDEFRQSLMGG